MDKVIGVVLAGGKGERLGVSFPKQFSLVGDEMIVEYTINNLGNAKRIKEIYIVVNSNNLKLVEKIRDKYPKITKIIKGGSTRNESIRNSILELENNVEKVIFIAAVRPFVQSYIFDDFADLLDEYSVVTFCTPVSGYVARKDGNFVSEILNRHIIKLCKSPMGYKAKVLMDIAEIAPIEEFSKIESDLELIRKYLPDINIFLYESNSFNFKITYEEDLELASHILSKGF